MIADKQTLQLIQKSWESVRIYEDMMDTHLNPRLVGSPFGFVRAPVFDKICYSLLVPLAFSVLEDALKQLRFEGTFSSNRTNLSDLMQSSQSPLPWNDFNTIWLYRNRRNGIAHDQKLVNPQECKDILDKIEDELVAWGILSSKIKGHYSISIGSSNKQV